MKGKMERLQKLMRPIYGLKQASRNWNEELDKFLSSCKFRRLESSSCIYVRDDGTMLVVYVDDILIFSREDTKIDKIVKKITQKYEIKDLGEVLFILGIKVERDMKGNMQLTQKSYIKSILKKYGMEECRGAKTPLEPGIRLSTEMSPRNQEEASEMYNVPYREAIGSLMHLAVNTRPDILFAVTKLSQYNVNPVRQHWGQVKHVLRYLSKTMDYGIKYTSNKNKNVEVYSDADWGSDLDDRHSFSGLIMKVAGNVVEWRSAKQKCISTSTMEAEYVAMSHGVKAIVWLKMVLNELNLLNCFAGIQLFCDNRAAIDFSINNIDNTRSRHIGHILSYCEKEFSRTPNGNIICPDKRKSSRRSDQGIESYKT